MIVLHPDRNVSPAEFRGLGAQGKLHVTKVFRTIQGEGPYSGTPAVFLRLSGCNLGAKKDCPWCDTEFSLRAGQQFTMEAVQAQINAQRFIGGRANLIVVTGGEPLLQWEGVRQLIRLMDVPENRELTFQFESNGLYLTQDIIEYCSDQVRHCNVQFVVSPKVPVALHHYLNLPEWWFDAPAKWMIDLKYVVTANEDSDYHELPEQIIHRATRDLPLCDVYVSGMTVYDGNEIIHRDLKSPRPPSIWRLSEDARAATERNYRHAAQLALSHGFRLSYQTHLLSGLE